MKSLVKKSFQIISSWPFIGWFVHILVGIVRLPHYNHRQSVFELERFPSLLQTVSDLQNVMLDIEHRQQACEAEQLPALQNRVSELTHRQQIFETEQLPSLLETISDLNQRQIRSDNAHDNLVKSVPVSLRKIAREAKQTQEEFSKLTESLHTQLSDFQDRELSEKKLIDSQLIGFENRLSSELKMVIESSSEAQKSVSIVSDSVESEVEKLAGVSNSISYLLGRVEFVRRELMFELRYGAGSESLGNSKKSLVAKAKILSQEKLALAKEKGQVYLNVGCGHISKEGYLNVDRRELPGIDIVAEADELPFGCGEVAEISSSHLLEHFPQEQLRRSLLPYYFKLLATNGKFHVVVPDAEAMIHEYSHGGYPYGKMREVFFGSQDYDGDFHYNMFTPSSLGILLEEAGFMGVETIESSRRNGDCFEFEMVAYKT